MEKYLGENTPQLGFGLMRLPTKDGNIDIEQTSQMVDEFLDNGFTYFDTAYVYDKGESEKAIKKALVERYPRDSYTLATKLNAWLGNPTEEEAKQQFYTSLERTGAGYFDYYLLHAIQNSNVDLYDKYHLWDYVKELKEKGLIKHWGFSFHGGPELLDKLLTEHPDAEFVQLQINYADWNSPTVQSKAVYEVTRKHNKPVVIMEPVKGGNLANPPEAVKEIFEEADQNASPASWAVKYAASLDGLITVLSGMSNLEQMEDNLSYMKDFKPLTPEEREVVEKAQYTLENMPGAIPCTACHYCTDNCPQNIPIPEIFAARNQDLIWSLTDRAKTAYANATKDKGKASECIECLQCEGACPQQLNVTEYLKECASFFE